MKRPAKAIKTEANEGKSKNAEPVQKLRIEVQSENEVDLLYDEPVNDKQMDYLVKCLDRMQKIKEE